MTTKHISSRLYHKILLFTLATVSWLALAERSGRIEELQTFLAEILGNAL